MASIIHPTILSFMTVALLLFIEKFPGGVVTSSSNPPAGFPSSLLPQWTLIISCRGASVLVVGRCHLTIFIIPKKPLES
jgi:hypothetical protein